MRRLGTVALLVTLIHVTAGSTRAREALLGRDRAALASVALGQGKFAEAEVYYRMALTRTPDAPALVSGLALAVLFQGRSQEAVAMLERSLDRRPGQPDLSVALSRALIAGKRFNEARELMEGLAPPARERADVKFQLGLAYLELGRYPEAERLMRAVAGSGSPLRDQAKLYQSVALARSDRRQEAVRLLELLKQQPVQANVGRVVDRFLTDLTAAPAPGTRRTRGSVKLTAQYDDNALIVPTTNVFGLAGQASASSGTALRGLVQHDFERTSRRSITGSYEVYQTVNFQVPDVNLQDHAAALSLIWNDPGAHQRSYGLTAGYGQLLIDERSFLGRFFVAPFYTWMLRPDRSFTVHGRATGKNFLNESPLVDHTADDRDADNFVVGATQSCQSKDRSVTIGYEFDRENASGANMDYKGHRLIVNSGGGIGRSRFEYLANAQVHLRDYDHVQSAFGLARQDREKTVTGALSYRLHPDRRLSLEYTWDRNVSNIALYDYVRRVTSLGMIWSF
ncbi:MAG: tetratricopeptide repeat protein [Candidatus Riflebacteria bacterium]|nr:tetratricopeptide repeat protein [Candidatus Riflebacteria bacterium]